MDTHTALEKAVIIMSIVIVILLGLCLSQPLKDLLWVDATSPLLKEESLLIPVDSLDTK